MYCGRFVTGLEVAIGSAAAISKVAIYNGHCSVENFMCSCFSLQISQMGIIISSLYLKLAFQHFSIANFYCSVLSSIFIVFSSHLDILVVVWQKPAAVCSLTFANDVSEAGSITTRAARIAVIKSQLLISCDKVCWSHKQNLFRLLCHNRRVV